MVVHSDVKVDIALTSQRCVILNPIAVTDQKRRMSHVPDITDATSRLDSVTGRSWPMTPLTGGDNLEGQVLLEPVLHLTIPHIQETVTTCTLSLPLHANWATAPY